MNTYKQIYPKPPQEVSQDPQFQEGMRGILTHEFHRILTHISQEFPEVDQDILNESFLIDLSVQENLYRYSGANSTAHPLAVLKILTENEVLRNSLDELSGDELTDIFSAALLHDSLEEAQYQAMDLDPIKEQIEDLGGNITHLVSLVTKPGKKERPSLSRSQYEILYTQGLRDLDHARGTYQQMKRLDDEEEYPTEILEAARTLKAADIIHNLRTLSAFEAYRQKRFIDETIALWIPAFSKDIWGMSEIATLLEEECRKAEEKLGEKD